MAYTPTEWKNGDVITAEKLNKLEEGVQEASENNLKYINFAYSSSSTRIYQEELTYESDYTGAQLMELLSEGVNIIGILQGPNRTLQSVSCEVVFGMAGPEGIRFTFLHLIIE